MAVRSRPLTSAGVEGMTTCKPGTALNQFSKDWRVLRRLAAAGADRRADDQRHADGAAEHVADLGDLVDQLVHADGDPVAEEDLGDRPQAGGRRTQRAAHDGGLEMGVSSTRAAPNSS